MFSDSSYHSFAIENKLKIVEGDGGFPFIEIDNEHASAVVSIYGAQVLSYKNKSGSFDKDLFFVSDKAYFEKGKAIKGGVPLCWPWFGIDQEGIGKQMHGFVRNLLWQLEETKTLINGETQIILSLTESKETLRLWSHKFKLTYKIIVGKTLELSLKTINTCRESFKITQALHAYFAVDDIHQTEIMGLDKINYLDKVEGASKAILQKGKIRIDQEIDRIYLDVPSHLMMSDESTEREVTIKSKGSKTAIVWNPWVDISQQSADLSVDAYQYFVCIETANAVDDCIVIEPNESHTITAEYTIT